MVEHSIRRLTALLLTVLLTALLLGQTFSVNATEATETQNPNSTSAQKDKLQQQINELNEKYEQLGEQQQAIKQQIANATTCLLYTS